MYAIIRTGGKQYKVEAGDEILVEKLDLEAGAEVCFEVLMLWSAISSAISRPITSFSPITAPCVSALIEGRWHYP